MHLIAKTSPLQEEGVLAPKMDTWRIWFARPQAHMEALGKLYTMASTDVPVEERQMAVGGITSVLI